MAITPDDKKISQFPEVIPLGGMFIPLIDLDQADPSLRNVRATVTALLALVPVSGGTVTDFSAGDLSPIFTTSVATSTSTPSLSFSLSAQSANQVFAGPTGGGAAAPTFRALVATDIPNLSSLYDAAGAAAAALVSANAYTDAEIGALSAVYQPLNTNLTTISGLGDPGADRILFWDESANALAWLEVGANLTITGTVLSATGGGSGTVTDFSAGNLSPIFTTNVATSTTTPALSFTLSTQSSNTVLSGPTNGADAAPAFRALVSADIPDLSSLYDVAGAATAAETAANAYTDGEIAGLSTVYQPLNANLTSISALTTTSYGLDFLELADAAAARTYIGAGTGSGSVTSINLTAPAAGITVSGGPITTSGSITLALADDLAALEALSGTDTIYYRSGASTWTAVTIGSNLSFTSGTLSASAPGTGTVTSFSAGDLSPIFTSNVATATTTPALTFTLSTQTANLVFSGPSAGGAAAPTFRALVAADIPDLSGVYQPLNANLTQISGITPGTNNLMQYKSGSWATRTLTQVWQDFMADPGVGAYAYTALPFTITDDKRLLGRDSALPPFTATEIALGNSLGLSSGILDTTQDIRTSATPTFAGLAVTGNITATGSGLRFLADMTNATIANRFIFQSSTANGNSNVLAAPNGTATLSSFTAVNASDPTNAGKFEIYTSPSLMTLNSGHFGSGTTLPIAIAIDDAEVARFTSTGFEGAIGATTPSTGKFTTVQTDSPSGGTTQPWKLGSIVGEEVQIEVNGVPRTAMLNNSGWLFVSVKNATVNTAGSPSDVATITLPPWATRWTPGSGGPASHSVMVIYAETAAGTLAGASFILRDGPSGGGAAMTLSAAGPSAAGVVTAAAGVLAVSTSSTVYIHQTANSANAGTVSFYVTIIPII